jgi:hypothetical protein
MSLLWPRVIYLFSSRFSLSLAHPAQSRADRDRVGLIRAKDGLRDLGRPLFVTFEP